MMTQHYVKKHEYIIVFTSKLISLEGYNKYYFVLFMEVRLLPTN